MQISVRVPALDTYPKVKLLDHMVILYLFFLRNYDIVFQCTIFTSLPTVYKGSNFCKSSLTLVIFLFFIFFFFDSGHLDECEVACILLISIHCQSYVQLCILSFVNCNILS